MLPIVFKSMLTISEKLLNKELIVFYLYTNKNNATVCLRSFNLMVKHCVDDSTLEE